MTYSNYLKWNKNEKKLIKFKKRKNLLIIIIYLYIYNLIY